MPLTRRIRCSSSRPTKRKPTRVNPQLTRMKKRTKKRQSQTGKRMTRLPNRMRKTSRLTPGKPKLGSSRPTKSATSRLHRLESLSGTRWLKRSATAPSWRCHTTRTKPSHYGANTAHERSLTRWTSIRDSRSTIPTRSPFRSTVRSMAWNIR